MLGRDKTWRFFEKHFEELQRMFGSSTVEMISLIKVNYFQVYISILILKSIIRQNFIEKFSSEDKANEFESFFGSKYITGVEKGIETSIEKIRINAKWLNRDIIQIREFFSKNSFDINFRINLS